MSVRIEDHIGKPCTCVMGSAEGNEVYTGTLEAVDGSFNTLLKQCTHSTTATTSSGAASTSTSASPRTLVRGDHVAYICLN